VITLRAPRQQRDGRWTASAEITWGAEMLELRATASDRVYRGARGWIDEYTAALWSELGKSIRVLGADGDPLKWGCFSSLPALAAETDEQLRPVPIDAVLPVSRRDFPALFAGVMRGNDAARAAHAGLRASEPARTVLELNAGRWPSVDDVARRYYAEHAAGRWAARDRPRRALFGCAGSSCPCPVRPGDGFEFVRALISAGGE
jgi:hypothetical protein